MTFTRQEMKLIKRLRKQERQWAWARWLLLAAGVFSITGCAGCGYFLYLFASQSRRGLDSITVFLIVLIWTKCCFYLVFGTWAIITTCVKWHGDVNRMLLLKLLDVHQQEAVTDG